LGMGGNGGKPKPGGAQIIKGKGMGGATQVQPAFASVTSVTPGEIAVTSGEIAFSPGEIAVSPEEMSPADGIALGVDGDAQAPIPNPPTTTNKVHARLFDMSTPPDLSESVRSMLRAVRHRLYKTAQPGLNHFYRTGVHAARRVSPTIGRSQYVSTLGECTRTCRTSQ
jgi:hypothetical protein